MCYAALNHAQSSNVTLIDLNQIFLIKPSEYEISLSVKSYDEKNVENYQNYYIIEKSIVSKLSKISIPNLNSNLYR